MCPPDFYGIEYEINPWMSVRRPASPDVARLQWERLYDLLSGPAGLDVLLLDPVKGLPDLVFTANAGLVRGSVFIPSRFRFPERRPEAPRFTEWFRRQGYEIRPLPGEHFFEGEGDYLSTGTESYAGYRSRTDIRSHAAVGEIVGERVLSLELPDPRFYHLDTCFCPLGSGAVAWYPPAFDRYGRSVVEGHAERRIAVPEGEALRFACNAVVAGRAVVMNSGCPVLRAALEREGYEVWETELSEFIKAGGSAKCLVLHLDREGEGGGPAPAGAAGA
jgi:N-dimethylarginine dimethylaminohydrolase